MKKKIFAALAASVMLCGVLTAPAAAEAGYKKGDVNMDGEIDSADVTLALIDYTEYLVNLKAHTLTEEQLELADIDGKTHVHHGFESKVTIDDCMYILMYYAECVANPQLKNTDIQTWLADLK